MINLMQVAAAGLAHAQAGRMAEAEACFQTVAKLSPIPTAPILRASLLPPIYQSIEDVRHWRHRLERSIGELVDQGLRQHLALQFAVPEFLAQYQGLNDRPLQELRARLYIAPQNVAWSKKRERKPGEKIRVGLISKYFRDHTIGRLMQGVVAKLPREDFHVTVLSVGDPRDPIADFYRRHADYYAVVPEKLPQCRQLVIDSQLDVIYYTDLGMEPLTYTLAQSRLAPVQCATWGHPVTSGLKMVDYFISAEGLEPADSQDQYTERLVKLKNLAIYYYRPILSSPAVGREYFGLPPDAHLYGCPQSLYKFHPDFDAILSSILRADPKGILVLLAAPYPEWHQLLLTRFARTMPDVMDRIKFVPRQKLEGFLQLQATCDVLLDPLHFGGGNTIYEALALGTPVITLPSQMLRGRLAYKMYETMGMMDCVAEDSQDYVRLAVEIGTQKERSEAIREKILATSGILYENMSGINQLAEFWKSVAE